MTLSRAEDFDAQDPSYRAQVIDRGASIGPRTGAAEGQTGPSGSGREAQVGLVVPPRTTSRVTSSKADDSGDREGFTQSSDDKSGWGSKTAFESCGRPAGTLRRRQGGSGWTRQHTAHMIVHDTVENRRFRCAGMITQSTGDRPRGVDQTMNRTFRRPSGDLQEAARGSG
jgi:hypothetical protein